MKKINTFLFATALVAVFFSCFTTSCSKDEKKDNPITPPYEEPQAPDTIAMRFSGYYDTILYDEWQAKRVTVRYEDGLFYVNAYKYADTIAHPYPQLYFFSGTKLGAQSVFNKDYNFKYIENGYITAETTQGEKIMADWEIAAHQSAGIMGMLNILDFDPVELVVSGAFSGIMLNQEKYYAKPTSITEVRYLQGYFEKLKLTKSN